MNLHNRTRLYNRVKLSTIVVGAADSPGVVRPLRTAASFALDLVARTTDGRLWAIQTKAVSPDRSIPKSELDSFLSESNRPEFEFRLIIATTDDIGQNARPGTGPGCSSLIVGLENGDILNTPFFAPTGASNGKRLYGSSSAAFKQALTLSISESDR